MGVLRIVLVTMAITAGCGGADDTADSGDVDASGTYASIAVEPPSVTLTVAIGTTQTQAYTAFGVAADGTRTEITGDCGFAIEDGYGAFIDATATIGYRGGKAIVTAGCGG